jgi:hypothetical protein
VEPIERRFEPRAKRLVVSRLPARAFVARDAALPRLPFQLFEQTHRTLPDARRRKSSAH